MKKVQFTLKSNSNAIVNDEVYEGGPFDILEKKYRFIISPKVNHWRFGIRLSETEEFEFSKTSRHDNKKYVDIHLAIGQFDGSIWRTPNDFKLGQYHLPSNHIIDSFDYYVPLTNVFWDIGYNTADSKLTLSVIAGNKELKGSLDISNYKYFKIFAWADGAPYELSCNLSIYDPNEEMINYWLLKLNPDSFKVEEFNKGDKLWFGTHNTKFDERPEYELFFELQRRDKVIGYAFKEYKSVICLLEISKPVSSHPTFGESIELEITEIKEPTIPIDDFKESIPDSLYSALSENLPIRLISLDFQLYETILTTKVGTQKASDSYEENVNLINDVICEEDLLTRTPFVNALADYIERLWVSQPKEAYTIHLSGEWGSGKSNILTFLEKRLEKKDNRVNEIKGPDKSSLSKAERNALKKELKGLKKQEREAQWLVIKYNAWENQHVNPPWWIFMDNVYKGIIKKEKKLNKLLIWFKEQWWRFITINRLYWVSFLLLGFVSYLLVSQFDLKNLLTTSNSSKDQGETLQAIATLFSIIGTFWLVFKAISRSLIPGSSEAALNFQKNIRDPMETLKRHFKSVISYSNKNVAIFIDDIDRCNSDNTVSLLEGMQTLFKSTRVLYIISGDSAWIKQCFEQHYERFSKVIESPGHKLGDFFLEKIFQMNTTVPYLSENAIKDFWKILINGKSKTEKQNKEDEFKLNQARQHFKSKTTEKEINEIIESKTNTKEEMYYRQAAVEQISNKEVLQNITHRLEKYVFFLPPNPRALKRLINNYALARQSLILQGTSLKDVNMDSLVRWLVICSKYPEFAEKISKDPYKIQDKEYIKIAGFSDLVKNHLNPDVVKEIIGK